MDQEPSDSRRPIRSSGRRTFWVDKNRQVTHEILEEKLRKATPAAGTDEQKIGDYYASCMDHCGDPQKAGTTPLDPLARPGSAASSMRRSVAPVIAALQIDGVDAFFGFGSGARRQGQHDQHHRQLDQGGLGLPQPRLLHEHR